MTQELSNIGEKFGALHGRPVTGSFDRFEPQVWEATFCFRVKRRTIIATIDHESRHGNRAYLFVVYPQAFVADGLGTQSNRILTRVHSFHHFTLLGPWLRPIGRGASDHGFRKRHPTEKVRS